MFGVKYSHQCEKRTIQHDAADIIECQDEVKSRTTNMILWYRTGCNVKIHDLKS